MLKLKAAAVAATGALVMSGTIVLPGHADPWQPMETTAARVDNPLKGFMPFGVELNHEAANFPYTMEWMYLPLNAVVKGEGEYDWSLLEKDLAAIAERGHQVALRFYLDYPGRETGVPDYLLRDGGIDQSRRYDFFDNKKISFSPDYDDPRVASLITDFASAFGQEYDADPRIGFITTGLVGFWGEQHTWPMNGYADAGAGNPAGEQWMPKRETELSFYRAWDRAFDTTKLLNRNPAADFADVNVGFHDDSFAVSTLPSIDWHFMSHIRNSGMVDRWKTESIGGELQPPVQQCVFEESGCKDPVSEDFGEAVDLTHVSWLVNQQAYTSGYEGTERETALAAHASLGYDLAATEAMLEKTAEGTKVSLRITNRGVAPFYYDWPAYVALLDDTGAVKEQMEVGVDLRAILPGTTVEVFATVPPGEGLVAFQIPNAMEGGANLKLANAAQDADVEGWLSLGRVTGDGVTPATPTASPSGSASGSSPEPATAGPRPLPPHTGD